MNFIKLNIYGRHDNNFEKLKIGYVNIDEIKIIYIEDIHKTIIRFKNDTEISCVEFPSDILKLIEEAQK